MAVPPVSWHHAGHRIAQHDPDRAQAIATCGELLTANRHDLSPTEPGPETRCPHCTWDPPTPHLPAAAVRHHLNAARAAHQGARRP